MVPRKPALSALNRALGAGFHLQPPYPMKHKPSFLDRFTFDPTKRGFVGVEREQFLVGKDGRILAAAPQFLQALETIERPALVQTGFELSACQIESKIGPCGIAELRTHLISAERYLEAADQKLGIARINLEVAPEDMPLTVFPDPSGRYQAITASMPTPILRAACRVAATHIHVGVSNIDHAIQAYNRAINSTSILMDLGDHSNGARIALYKTMAPKWEPKPFASPEDFSSRAEEIGYAHDPRSCWTVIRISKHGTVEFRMFGATSSIDKIVHWATICKGLCE